MVSGDSGPLARSPLLAGAGEGAQPEPLARTGPPAARPEPGGEALAWSPVERLLFRFLLVYLVLYNFPFPLNAIPYVALGTQPYQELWNAVVPWVGSHVFGVAITVLPNGSGDTTYNYVQVFCFAVLAAAAALAWTLLDRRRTHHARLACWLRIYVRYSLALTLVSYGAYKVIQSQFPPPGLDRLLQTFGDASPMGLLWTFMGASAAYNVYTGLAEIVPGLLLTVRRTTLLGALLAIAAMSNVVMLNFSYDVPVKLYSAHLLAMGVFLAWPDLRRLADLFLWNRPVPAAPLAPLFARPSMERASLAVRTLLVAGYTGMALYGSYQGSRSYGDLAPRPPLHGIWNVDALEVDGKPRPPLLSDGERWRRVVFDDPGTLAIQQVDGSRRRFALALDEKAHRLALSRRDDPAWKAELTYRQERPGLLAVEGTFEGKRVKASLRRAEEVKFLLRERGFHWINEYPFNR